MCRICAIIILLTAAFSILSCHNAYAEGVSDGFIAAETLKSRYFIIYVESGVDLENLAIRISVPSSIIAIIRAPTESYHSDSVPDQLDLLYMAVSEILDIRLGKFSCTIKICTDSSRLLGVAENLFGQQIQSDGFYVAQLNTLYVDAQNISINILGHELSHAIQCNYFVIPPPVKLQEVLSGYVEFQLRKYTNTLPRR